MFHNKFSVARRGLMLVAAIGIVFSGLVAAVPAQAVTSPYCDQQTSNGLACGLILYDGNVVNNYGYSEYYRADASQQWAQLPNTNYGSGDDGTWYGASDQNAPGQYMIQFGGWNDRAPLASIQSWDGTRAENIQATTPQWTVDGAGTRFNPDGSAWGNGTHIINLKHNSSAITIPIRDASGNLIAGSPLITVTLYNAYDANGKPLTQDQTGKTDVSYFGSSGNLTLGGLPYNTLFMGGQIAVQYDGSTGTSWYPLPAIRTGGDGVATLPQVNLPAPKSPAYSEAASTLVPGDANGHKVPALPTVINAGSTISAGIAPTSAGARYFWIEDADTANEHLIGDPNSGTLAVPVDMQGHTLGLNVTFYAPGYRDDEAYSNSKVTIAAPLPAAGGNATGIAAASSKAANHVKVSLAKKVHAKTATVKVTVKFGKHKYTGKYRVYYTSKKYKSFTVTSKTKSKVISVKLPKLKLGSTKIKVKYYGSSIYKSSSKTYKTKVIR